MAADPAFGTYKEVNLQRRWKKLFNRRVPGSIRKYVKKYIRKEHYAKIIDHTECGIKLRCYPFQNVHDMKFVTDQLFKEESHKFKYVEMNKNKIDVLLDIGANTGTICIPLAVFYPEKLVYAIEPNPEAFSRLSFNKSINSAPNLTLVNAGFGECSKRATIFVPQNMGSGSIHETKSSLKYLIDMIDIDKFYKDVEIKGSVVLKVDIEGYEDRAIMPLFKRLPENDWPKAVIIEHSCMHLWNENCIQFMEANGYKQVYSDKSDTILERW
jgi:FkbM family methyltransferase